MNGQRNRQLIFARIPIPIASAALPLSGMHKLRWINLRRIFHEEGWRTLRHFDSLQVTKRSASGRALLLNFGGDGIHLSISASSFRFAINRALGWNTIRSDWYRAAITGAVLRVDGKGYGHGVGLCQAGAYEMAAEGHDYRDILRFYFPGTVIRIAASDSGWRKIEGAGWTLRSATSQPELIEAGNAAWIKAQQLFPPHSPIHPIVFSLPTTDLFRQLTSEPGWVLASTRGSDIYLQPAGIIRKNGTAQATLLHEFLHVLVEQEAAQTAPLWLREGLVEALAGSSQHDSSTGPRMSLRTDRRCSRASRWTKCISARARIILCHGSRVA